VEGEPFPGVPGPVSWSALERPTLSLLETLTRVHAEGLVHRDLKPSNILVTSDGRPILLDFGIARGPALGSRMTPSGQMLGTFRYLAPEQALDAHRATAASDLYSLGCVLYEALTGSVPHDAADGRIVAWSRTERPAVPVAQRAASVPAYVARVVDAMLAQSPSGRPASAAEVLDLFQRRAVRPRAVWLGSRDPIDRILSAAMAGQSIDVVGPSGSGRSRVLDEVEATLRADGITVMRLERTRKPFGALRNALNVDENLGLDTASALRAFVIERLTGVLRAGAVLVVDDFDLLERDDRHSVVALQRVRSEGVVIRASRLQGEAQFVELAPLSETDLVPMFAGTSRLFHIPEDAAAAMLQLTGGNQANVQLEAESWIRVGLASRTADGSVLVERRALDRLRAGIGIRTHWRADTERAGDLPTRLARLAAVASIAWPNSRAVVVARAVDRPVVEVELDFEDLVDRGAAQFDGECLVPLVVPDVQSQMDDREISAVHAAIAAELPRDAERRIHHLLLGCQSGAVVEEAVGTARRLALSGRERQALEILSTAFGAIGRTDTLQENLLALESAKVALPTFVPRCLNLALYNLERCRAPDSGIRVASRLIRRALDVLRQPGDTTLARLEKDSCPVDDELGLWWHAIRVYAARGCDLGVEEQTLDEAEQWVSGSDSVEGPAALGAWRGLHLYRRGEYLQAADLHALAAERRRSATARLSSMLNQASSLMEAGSTTEALAVANTALERARELRRPFYEARAEWVRRSCLYRSGRAVEPDLELLDAARSLEMPDQLAGLCLTEASVAWRAGSLRLARELALEAERAWTECGRPYAHLATCLAVAAGYVGADEGNLAASVSVLQPPILALQGLSLLHMASTPVRWPHGLSEGVQPDRWYDILTGAEVLGCQPC
jgi:eukaryotic-like serine/threonine-protein kinase